MKILKFLLISFFVSITISVNTFADEVKMKKGYFPKKTVPSSSRINAFGRGLYLLILLFVATKIAQKKGPQ